MENKLSPILFFWNYFKIEWFQPTLNNTKMEIISIIYAKSQKIFLFFVNQNIDSHFGNPKFLAGNKRISFQSFKNYHINSRD